MPDYKPLPIPKPKLLGDPLYKSISVNKDLGGLLADFEPFEPDRRYSFVGRAAPERLSWKIIKPQTARPIVPLPMIIQKLIKSTWKFAEPSWDNVRGSLPGHVAHGISIGTRGGGVPQPVRSVQYSPQVRPTNSVITTTFPNENAIASDWKLFEQIERTNAVTFRGDSRPPVAVIIKANGFHPPNSRQDGYYLENNIYVAFADYLERRRDPARAAQRRVNPNPDAMPYNLTKQDFLTAAKGAAPTPEIQSLLIDHLMWRKITEKEAVHLGRMVENECLKGYISTAKSIDTSLDFATGFGGREGWLYLNIIYSGFIVPSGQQNYWGSEEAEIAQWGAVPGARIVGFVHVSQSTRRPDGPIFMRRSFRTSEPVAFEHMFKVMSGWIPG